MAKRKVFFLGILYLSGDLGIINIIREEMRLC